MYMEDKIIYEVLRVIDGKPLFLEKHLARMENSFKLINKTFTLKYEDICARINKLIKYENKNMGNIKITYKVNEDKLDIFFKSFDILLTENTIELFVSTLVGF